MDMERDPKENETRNKRYLRGKPMEFGLGETQGGREQVVVRFDITTPEAPEHSLTWYGYFTEASASRTVESLRYCGWAGDDLTDIQLDPNIEVELVVEDEFYSGQWRTKVQFINRAGGLAIKAPLSGDRAKAFAASMRATIKALDAAKPELRAGASSARQAPASPGAARPASSASSSAARPPRAEHGDRRPEPPPLGDDWKPAF